MIDERESKSYAKRSNKDGPLNVILLIVDGSSEKLAHVFWDRFSFPIRMLLQVTFNIKVTVFVVKLFIFYLFGQRLQVCPISLVFAEPTSCNCNLQLRTNVASLLSWAQEKKKMSTST